MACGEDKPVVDKPLTAKKSFHTLADLYAAREASGT